MDYPPQKKHSRDPRVNMASVNHEEARIGATATSSLLSEGEAFCNVCGLRIDEEAIFLGRKVPRYHANHDTECLTTSPPACYERAVAS